MDFQIVGNNRLIQGQRILTEVAYSSPTLAASVVQKTRVAREEIGRTAPVNGNLASCVIAILAAAAVDKVVPVRVIDLGGAAGIHAFTIRHALERLPLRWAVVETPSMVEKARALEDEGLRFFVGMDAALDWLGDVDVLHASGSVQYILPAEETVKRMVALDAPWMAISRLPLVDGAAEVRDSITRFADHGPGPLPPGFTDIDVTSRVALMNRRGFLDLVSSRYRMVGSLDVKPSGFQADAKTVWDYNFLFLRKAAS